MYAAVAPRRELDDALVDLARAAGVDVRDGCTFAGMPAAVDDEHGAPIDVVDRWRRRSFGPATSSPPTGCGARCARPLGLAQPGYLGEWHAFRQYAATSRARPPSGCTCGSKPTSCPGTRGRSRCPDGRANVGFGVLRDGTPAGRRT